MITESLNEKAIHLKELSGSYIFSGQNMCSANKSLQYDVNILRHFCYFLAPSGAPRRVIASPRSSNSVIIQWLAPLESTWNGDLLGYIIRYRLAGYPTPMENVTVNNYQSKIYELKNLIIFKEYEIAVAAFNAKGMGVMSDIVKVWTLEGVPSEAPRDVIAEATNSTSIKVLGSLFSSL